MSQQVVLKVPVAMSDNEALALQIEGKEALEESWRKAGIGDSILNYQFVTVGGSLVAVLSVIAGVSLGSLALAVGGSLLGIGLAMYGLGRWNQLTASYETSAGIFQDGVRLGTLTAKNSIDEAVRRGVITPEQGQNIKGGIDSKEIELIAGTTQAEPPNTDIFNFGNGPSAGFVLGALGLVALAYLLSRKK